MSDAAQQAPGTPLAAGSSFRARLPSAACAAALAVTVSALALPSILEASPAGQKGDAPSAFAAQMTIATLQDQIRADRVAIANELRAMATDYWELDCRTEALRALTRLLEVDDSGETDVLFAALCYATQGAPETATTLLLAWAERHAQHQPSIRLCRAISVFADAAGRSSTADEWRGRAAEERKDAVGQRWSAASWLSWAGLTDVAGSEREAILREAPASSTATYVLQARARNALATNQFTEAADAYIEAGRRHADRSGFSGRARMDGATGFACRAIALDLEGDDEGARAAMLCAERWAGGEPGSLGRLLWVLEKASPAPWVVALVRRVADHGTQAKVDAGTAEIAHEAKRWLGTKLQGDVILKQRRRPERAELNALLAPLDRVVWVAQDTAATHLRWVGTANQFVLLDDARKWEVRRWPDVMLDMDRGALKIRDAAFNEDAVWIGTTCGLFRYDRRADEWTQEVIDDLLLGAETDAVVMGTETLTVRVIRDGVAERWRYWWNDDTWQQD